GRLLCHRDRPASRRRIRRLAHPHERPSRDPAPGRRWVLGPRRCAVRLTERHRYGTAKAGGSSPTGLRLASTGLSRIRAQSNPPQTSCRLAPAPDSARSGPRPSVASSPDRRLRSGVRELTQHVLRHASMTKIAEIGMSTLRNARSGAYRSFKYRFRLVGEAPTSTFYVSDS